MLTGYLHPFYAQSLSEFGTPRELPHCGGWILERQIPESPHRDAMGCYPLFACQNWSGLASDLASLENDLVSLSLVADPFGDYSVDDLKMCFPDVMIPFKQHFVVDLGKPARDFVIDHHARNARKAFQRVVVELCYDPMLMLNDWIDLYEVLCRRHLIRGMTTFSRQSFTKQMLVPGMIAIRATADGSTVGMTLWYVVGDIAYYHLGAYSDLGYELRASFALFSFAIDHFACFGLKQLSLGGGAGTHGTTDDGLSRFKRGWSNGMRTAYFCGRVLDQMKYKEIISHKIGLPQISYFPLYRYGEF